MQVERIEPLLTASEAKKTERIRQLVAEHVDVRALGALLEM
jgi:BioD-like phosphotransacetylase family protein